MPDLAFPSPASQSTDVADFALSGSFEIGQIRVHHITDGLGFGVRSFWFNGIDPAVWMPPLGLTDPETPFPINFGLFVVVTPDAVILVDCGFGPAAHDIPDLVGADEMMTRLLEIGIGPDDVTHIVLTHLHFDHCGRLATADEKDALEVTFPRATVHLHERELAHWTGVASDDDPMSAYVRARLAPVLEAGLVRTFSSQMPLVDGVQVVPMTGHTAGHTCVLLQSDGASCLLVGDLAHHPIQFRHHDWLPVIDFEPAESVRARDQLCDLAISLDAVVTAPHMPILTLGRLGRDADGGVTWVGIDPESL